MVTLDSLLGECYRKDVIKSDVPGVDWLLSTPIAQEFRQEASSRLRNYEQVAQRCFISKKYAEYIKKLLSV